MVNDDKPMTTVMVKETQQLKRKVLANYLIYSVARCQIFMNIHYYNFFYHLYSHVVALYRIAGKFQGKNFRG